MTNDRAEPAQAPVALGLIGPPGVSCTPPTASVSDEL
jgi:hypothetical protein